MTVGFCPVMVEHEQPDGRRQIAVWASGIDLGDEVRQCLVVADGDLLEPSPEGVFKANAGLMASDNDRALDDWRVHCLSPFSTRTTPRSPCSEILGCDAQHRFSLFDAPRRLGA